MTNRLLCSTLVYLSCAGCASIMHGTHQDVGISSSPTAAVVTIDGVASGQTPLVAHLARGRNHILSIRADGYAPYETTLTRDVSGWVWGNLVFGGLIGLAVDGMDGGMYQLTPEQVHVDLRQNAADAPVQTPTVAAASSGPSKSQGDNCKPGSAASSSTNSNGIQVYDQSLTDCMRK